jgi:hypothetical protein
VEGGAGGVGVVQSVAGLLADIFAKIGL